MAKRTQEPKNVVRSADISGETRQNIYFFSCSEVSCFSWGFHLSVWDFWTLHYFRPLIQRGRPGTLGLFIQISVSDLRYTGFAVPGPKHTKPPVQSFYGPSCLIWTIAISITHCTHVGVCGKCVQQIMDVKGGQQIYDHRIMHLNHAMTISPKQKQAKYAIINNHSRTCWEICALDLNLCMSNNIQLLHNSCIFFYKYLCKMMH